MDRYILICLIFILATCSLKGQEELSELTIQNVWVNAGYFEWRTKDNSPEIWVDGMIALKITNLGIQQECLPDVTDGEQLNSVHKMFEGIDSFEKETKLKKAPSFNTSNVKDFSYMFKDCFFLDLVPMYNTASGENFHGMFYNCHSLHEIPQLNTSNGIDFGSMFFKTSIKSMPLIDTSKGNIFSFMFTDCFHIESIPLLNTSIGSEFVMTFQGCKSLKYLPVLDVSNSAHFYTIFGLCYSLEEIKLLGLGKGKPTRENYDFLLSSNDIDLPENTTIESLEFIIENGENLHSDVFCIKLDKKLEPQISQSLHEKARNKKFTLEFR